MDKLKAAYPRYTIADTSTVGAGGTPLSPWNSYLDRLAMVAIGSQATRASVQNGKMELSYTVNSEIAKTSLGERIKRLFGDRALARIEVVATPNAVDDPEAVFSDCIIFFDNGQKEFLGKEAGKLERVLTSMKTNPSIKLRVEGHTDNVGASAGNQLLSDNRASEVVKFLIEKGIAADRVQGKGFGAGRPADENKTDAGKAANRRVEFRIQ